MKRIVFQLVFVLIALLAAAAGLFLLHDSGDDFAPKRQSENEIIVYHDLPTVELFFENSDSRSVEIVAEMLIDGPYELCRATVLPGESLTVCTTPDGKPFEGFKPRIYAGRILVFDSESGELLRRIEPMTVRLYDSYLDAYDSIAAPAEPSPLPLDAAESRPEFYSLSADLQRLELYGGIQGLKSQDRALDIRVYVSIDGEDVLAAKYEGLCHRGLLMMLYMEKEAAELLEAGRVYGWARVDSYYADSGELYDSIPAELTVGKTG